jgi:Caspase domain
MSEFSADAARGISVNKDLSHKSGKLGAYRALIIGINDYKDPKIPDLKTAENDAKDMAELLSDSYGFQVQLLLGRKATKEAIYRALRNLATSTKSDDSVLIYYAGHGDLDRTYNDGWWITADSKGGPVTYLDNAQVQQSMRNMNARHVLLISDSCYSGTLFGQSRAIPQVIDNKYYLNLYNEKSRWGMTSGNKTPVSDAGSDGHSVFAYQLLKELRKNEKPYISIQELCIRIAPIVGNNSEQTPLCRPVRNTGDQGGEFVFVASSGAIEIAPYTELTAERGRLEEERMELERIKMEIEKKKIEAERKKLAAIPETTVDSSDDGMADNKLDSDKRNSLAVFPVSEIGFVASSVKDQKKHIDFIIKYTSDIPNIILTHSFYPYNKEYTVHQIKSIREIINKNIEKKIGMVIQDTLKKT